MQAIRQTIKSIGLEISFKSKSYFSSKSFNFSKPQFPHP